MDQQNPYQPPGAELVAEPAQDLPGAPPFGSGFLRAGAWSCGAALVLALPYYWESWFRGSFPLAVTIALGVVNTLLSIYVLYVLVRYLEYRHAAVGLRPLFYCLVVAGALVGISGIWLMLDDSEGLSPAMWATIVAMPLFGIPHALFGFRLKRFGHRSPMLVAIGWLTIISGFSVTSVFLALISVPLEFISSLLLVVVLLAGAREIRAAGFP